jgi:hypothetical protein
VRTAREFDRFLIRTDFNSDEQVAKHFGVAKATVTFLLKLLGGKLAKT